MDPGGRPYQSKLGINFYRKPCFEYGLHGDTYRCRKYKLYRECARHCQRSGQCLNSDNAGSKRYNDMSGPGNNPDSERSE